MKKSRKTVEKLNISLPAKWADLTPIQVVSVAKLLSEGRTETEFLVELGIKFSGLIPHGATILEDGETGYIYYNRNAGNIVLSAEHVAAIAYAMEWVFEEPESMSAPNIEGLKTPDSEIHGISIEQMITANTASAIYAQTKSPEILCVMVASLYPQKEYNSLSIESEAKRLSYLPMYHLEAVVLWWIGVKKMLQKRYPYVFPAGESGSVDEIDGSKLMQQILSSLNDGRIVDNDKIKEMDAHEALYELNLRIQVADKKHK